MYQNMYLGLKNELIRIITAPNIKLIYTNTSPSGGNRREQFILRKDNHDIVTVTKETINYCSWRYYLKVGPAKYSDTTMARENIQSLYELCVARHQFEQNQQNVAAMKFLAQIKTR